MDAIHEKCALIVAGPNGSGKTTLIQGMLAKKPLLYLSADKIAFALNPEHPEHVAVQAGRELLLQFDEAVRRGVSFVYETTLSGKTLLRQLARMKADGYVVEISFIFLASAESNVERVQERVRKGGHFVPENDIRRRYLRSKVNFWTKYKSIADEWFLFYNGETGFINVAQGSGDECLTIDSDLLAAFLADFRSEQDDE